MKFQKFPSVKTLKKSLCVKAKLKVHLTPNFRYNFFLQNHKIWLISESFATIRVKLCEGKVFLFDFEVSQNYKNSSCFCKYFPAASLNE